MDNLKKLLGTILAVSLALRIAGAVLLGVNFTTENFRPAPLGNAFVEIGQLGAVLSGIALVVLVVVEAVRIQQSSK